MWLHSCSRSPQLRPACQIACQGACPTCWAQASVNTGLSWSGALFQLCNVLHACHDHTELCFLRQSQATMITCWHSADFWQSVCQCVSNAHMLLLLCSDSGSARSGNKGISSGAVAGIVIAVVVIVAAAGGLATWYIRKSPQHGTRGFNPVFTSSNSGFSRF